MNDMVIETKQLTRYYGERCVVNQLNLKVRRGSVLGFLGRNGAGKTTAIRMLMGLEVPSWGSATILGYDCVHLPPEARSRIGYLAEGHFVYGWMTVQECASFQSSFYGTNWNWDVFHTIVRHFGLKEKVQAGDLSRGQRAGLCLAMTLAPEPELLILDDPSLGLDSVARRGLLEAMISVTCRADRTIVFSSHQLADVERVADEIAIMDNGVLRAHCSVDQFRQKIRKYVLRFKGIPPTVDDLPGLLNTIRTEKELVLTVANWNGETEKALAALLPESIDVVPQSLEETFVDYVNERGERTFLAQSMETNK